MARILIADDRSVNRELLVTLMRHAGHDTMEAMDGLEALECALRERPDALIVDFAMPRLDGLGFARALRSSREMSNVPIIFYTATENEREANQRAAPLNAAVLIKPSDPEVILATVDRVLGRRTKEVKETAAAEDDLSARLAALVELGIDLTSIASPQGLVEMFTRGSMEVMGAAVSSTVLVEDGKVRRFVAGSSIAGGWDCFQRAAVDLDPLMSHRWPYIASGELLHDSLLASPTSITTAIAARIETAQHCYGIVWFGNCGSAFTERDLWLASTLATQLALAYENACIQRSRTEQLHESAELVHRIFDLAPVAIIIFSLEGVIESWNKAAEQMFGWSAQEVVGRSTPLVPPHLQGEIGQVRQRMVDGETVTAFETKRIRKGGGLVDVVAAAGPLTDSQGKTRAIIVVFADITRLKRVESELAQRAAELEALSARLVHIQEEERSRIAREIHDELGQLLTAAKLELSALAATAESQGAVERAETVSRMIDLTIDTVRGIASELRPAVLDQFGVVAAIENETALFQQRTGIECDVSIRPENIVIDRDRSVVLFRIVQEVLTNVVRHASATRVELRLRKTPGDVVLDIRDNGVGIDPRAVHSSGSLGLIGMRERVRRIGGSLSIEGVPNHGTILSVCIPTKKEGT